MTVRLILGLGNPGPEYIGSRHNVGFSVVEELVRRRDTSWTGEQCRTLLAAEEGPNGTTLFGKPQTFMNRSGLAARGLIEQQDLATQDLLIVFDDIHLPLGRLRLRGAGGPGGHRGLESVIETLRSDQIPRLRLGIGTTDLPPVGDELVDFVLGSFEDTEQEAVQKMVARAADACESWIDSGTEPTMNRFNG